MHPGGPFWAKKDLGAWSIPKGEYSEGEDALAVAKREFEEETGARPQGDFLPLGEVVQRGRKIVTAWGLEGDFDPATLNASRFAWGDRGLNSLSMLSYLAVAEHVTGDARYRAGCPGYFTSLVQQ